MPSPLTEVRTEETRGEEVADPEKRVLEARKERLVEYFRGFMRETFDDLHVASASETEALQAGLEHMKLTEEEIAGWEQYRHSLADRQRASARELKGKLDEILSEATSGFSVEGITVHAISADSKQRWINRFRDESTGFKAKEYFVSHQMPSYLREWKEVAEKRARLLAGNPNLKSLKKERAMTFLNENDFLKLNFNQRKNLTAEVSGVKLSVGQSRPLDLLKKSRRILQAAVDAHALHPNKVGRWLERIFESSNASHQQVAEFIDLRLGKELIPSWMKARTRFDLVEKEMTGKSVPQGFNRLSADAFLMLNFPQRMSYVEEAERRMKIQASPEHGPMYDKKIFIRHALDTEDWDGAEKGITEARKTASEADRIEIDSMERYLKAFRTTDHEKKSPMEDARQTLEQMRSAFTHVPPTLQRLYLGALQDGADETATLSALIYNRVWCWRRGYLDHSKEIKAERKAETETSVRAKGEHLQKGTENIKLGVVGGSDGQAAIRKYQTERGATNIFMDAKDTDTVRTEIKSNKTNAMFRYWANLIPEGVSIEKQIFLVEEVNHVLKRGARKLEDAGQRFSLVDSPNSAN